MKCEKCGSEEVDSLPYSTYEQWIEAWQKCLECGHIFEGAEEG